MAASVLSGSCRHLLFGRVGRWQQRSSRRALLKAASPKINQTVFELREQLKNIVGSPKVWGEQRDPAATRIPLASSQAELPARRMIDSYQEAVLPLTSDLLLRQKYINFYNHVRYGRIMEDLDTMAVSIGYSHVRGGGEAKEKSSLSIVTALVDSIHMQSDVISPDKDLVIRGHVTWTGSTSLEVTLHVEQDEGGSIQRKVLAKFLMVARDPDNKGKAFINPLLVETPEEKELWQIGEKNKFTRQKDSTDSLLKTAPTEAERLIIHDLFLSTINQRAGSLKAWVKPEGSVWMEETSLKTVIICFPENRNLYNKIFGGFLMRQAFELAWANAAVYCKSRIAVVAVDDIVFRRPVEIGSLLYLSSQVVYTRSPNLEVRVHAEVVDPNTGARNTTNSFYFTFKCPNTFPNVMPRSYSEYMIYLDGKRHMEQGFENASHPLSA